MCYHRTLQATRQNATHLPLGPPQVPPPSELAAPHAPDALELEVLAEVKAEYGTSVLPHQHPVSRQGRLGILGDDVLALCAQGK